jgi:hypothetical protein
MMRICFLRAFRERHQGNAALNHPNSNPPLLAIALGDVGPNKKSAAKQLFRLGEMESVFSDVCVFLASSHSKIIVTPNVATFQFSVKQS